MVPFVAVVALVMVILEEEVPLVLHDVVERAAIWGLQGLPIVELWLLLPFEAHSIVVQVSAHGMLGLVLLSVHRVEGEDLMLAILLVCGTHLDSSFRVAVLNAYQLLERVVIIFVIIVHHLNSHQVLDHLEHFRLLRSTLPRTTAIQFSLAAWLA